MLMGARSNTSAVGSELAVLGYSKLGRQTLGNKCLQFFQPGILGWLALVERDPKLGIFEMVLGSTCTRWLPTPSRMGCRSSGEAKGRDALQQTTLETRNEEARSSSQQLLLLLGPFVERLCDVEFNDGSLSS